MEESGVERDSRLNNQMEKCFFGTKTIMAYKQKHVINLSCVASTPALPLPLGVTLALWLGVVNAFLLGRLLFLPDAGVRGGGSANMSTSFSCTATFSLFSWSRPLLSWRCGAAARPLSGVSDGDAGVFGSTEERKLVRSFFFLLPHP